MIQRTPDGDVYQGMFGTPKNFTPGTCVDALEGTDKHALMRKVNTRGRILAQSFRTDYTPIRG